jgi:FAD/FMN-containing dehydrogenase
MVEFEGESFPALRGRVGDAVRRLKGIALDVDTALTPEDEKRIWSLRHAASPIIADLPPGRRSLQVIEDACVPLSRMGEYILAVRNSAARFGIPIVIFGHAGDGNIHVNLLPEVDQPGWEVAVSTIYHEITDQVIQLGGTPSGEHGDGRIRAPLLGRVYGPEISELFARVKKAFDPSAILNPGVKLAGRTAGTPDGRTESALSDLKVGTGAAAIPPEIAEELREIERMGDYRRDRLRDPSLRSG